MGEGENREEDENKERSKLEKKIYMKKKLSNLHSSITKSVQHLLYMYVPAQYYNIVQNSYMVITNRCKIHFGTAVHDYFPLVE